MSHHIFKSNQADAGTVARDHTVVSIYFKKHPAIITLKLKNNKNDKSILNKEFKFISYNPILTETSSYSQISCNNYTFLVRTR